MAKITSRANLIGKNSEEWGIVKLKDVAKIRGNKTIKGIDRVAVIPMGLVPNSGIFTKYMIVPIEQVKSSTYCEAGDILLAKITPSLENGKQGIVPFDVPNGFALATTEVFPIAPDETKIDRFFLFYILKFNKFRQKIIVSMTGTTGRQRASKKAVENLLIPLPPLPEQKKIAEILRTVDEAIEKNDLAIERTERLKRGLMRELLTKGIGHEEFKKTEIGRIPKEWEVTKLEELLIAIQDTPHKVPKKATKGIPFVSVNYVLQFPDYNFYIDHSKAGIEYISEDNVEFIKKFTPERGDIIYTKWGTPGVAKLVNTDDKFIGLCSLALLKPNRSLVYPLFLVYALNSNATRKQIIPHSKTSTRTEIHKKHIRNILLPLPPLSEQQKIAEILSTVDRRLELLRKRREKLERIKRGLMKDLLTGRRRVKVG